MCEKKIMLDRMEQFMNLLLNTVKYFEFCRQIYNDYFFFKFLKTKMDKLTKKKSCGMDRSSKRHKPNFSPLCDNASLQKLKIWSYSMFLTFYTNCCKDVKKVSTTWPPISFFFTFFFWGLELMYDRLNAVFLLENILKSLFGS